MREYSLKTVITRVILARNDVLTPFDLRAQIFRVNVELSAYYHGQNNFRKMSEFDRNYDLENKPSHELSRITGKFIQYNGLAHA